MDTSDQGGIDMIMKNLKYKYDKFIFGVITLQCINDLGLMDS